MVETTAEEFNGSRRLEIIEELIKQHNGELYNPVIIVQ